MMKSSLAIDFALLPDGALQVLHPFEVADGDAAGVGQHVRQHEDTFARQDFVGVRRGGAVGGFGDDLGLDLVGVVQRDDVFQRRRAPGCRTSA